MQCPDKVFIEPNLENVCEVLVTCAYRLGIADTTRQLIVSISVLWLWVEMVPRASLWHIIYFQYHSAHAWILRSKIV